MTQSHIILVRHGEASASWSEHPDPGLSEDGKNQAQKTSKTFIPEFASFKLISSPKKRALETMEFIAKELNSSYETNGQFIEIPSDGISKDQKQRWITNILKTPIQDLPQPIADWQKNLISWLESYDGQAIIATHFMVINALVSHLMGNNVIAYFQPGYASKTEILIQNGVISKLTLGDTEKTVINL